MNYKVIRYTLGWVLILEAFAMILPLGCAFIYNDIGIKSFLYTIILCLAFGIPFVVKKPKNHSMYSKEGFIIVALAWIIMSIFGSFPFIFSGAIPDFIDAFFETVSGFTTTGASILTEVESLPKSILFWRSFTHWLGGMGVLVFLMAVLPLSGGNNMYMMKAESPGPSVTKLVPKVKSTAKILYGIYTVMTLIQIVFLLLGDMPLFEAITTSFGTAGTGGFGIKNDSLAGYSSYIQNVVTVFMILFGVNFSIFYLLLLGKIKDIFRSDEFKTYFLIIFTATTLIAINSYSYFNGVLDAIKHSAFQVGSIITTTGYSTTDFNMWPEFSKMVLVLLMFIGASAGSTGGGIKVSRILILLKTIKKELKIAAHPKSVHKVTLDGRPIEHEVMRSTNVYIIAYAAIFVVSLLIISLENFDFTTNFTSVATTINNIGPGLGLVGPVENFSLFSPLSTLVLSFDMLIGRLEIFPILVLLAPHRWKK